MSDFLLFMIGVNLGMVWIGGYLVMDMKKCHWITRIVVLSLLLALLIGVGVFVA